MIVVRSSQWSSSSLVLLLLSPSCLLLVTPEARISIPANDQLMASTVRCRREDSCHQIPSIARTDRRWFDSGTQYHTIGLRARPKQQQLSYSWLNIVTHRSPHSAQPSVSSREQHLEANVEFSRLTDVLGNTLSATYTLPFDRLLLLR